MNESNNDPELHRKLSWSLLLLRLSSFLVVFMWTADKFVNPEHAAKIFKVFYKIDGLSNVLAYTIGSVQMLILLAFLVGFQRGISYGLVLLMHTVSALSSFPKYLDPWSNLLFFAAWPMLAALFVVYWMREYDTYSVDGRRVARQ